MKSFKLTRPLRRIIIVVLGVALILTLAFLWLIHFPPQTFSISDATRAVIQPAVQNQQKIEAEIEAYYQNGTFSLADPLIIQNPYGTAPLTALLIFDTPEAMQIAVHVPGKTPQAAVDFTFAGFRKHHEIPVYGLYADTVNEITLTGENRAGQPSSQMVELKTEPLPVYLDPIDVVVSNPDDYQPGMNFTFLNHKTVFDINGDIRWYATESTFQTYMRLQNGHFLLTYLIAGEPSNVLMEQDLLGKIYAIYNLANGVHHDFTELPNGNLLVTSEDASSEFEEDHIIEIDRQSGYVVRDFDLKLYLDHLRKREINSLSSDWLHMNSIVYDASDRSIILSGRKQSAIVKMSYPEMKIQWILGPHDNWGEKFQPYLLTPLGDDFEWSWSQHHATILSEETIQGERVIDLLLFDNGLYRSFDIETALPPANSYSRVVRYRINETTRTVEQVWEYGKERGEELFSASRGSVYLLSNGNYLGEWSDICKDANGVAAIDHDENVSVSSRTIEINPANNQIVFDAVIDQVLNYRTLRAGLYDGYSAEDSILSARLNNTTQMTWVKQARETLQPLIKDSDTLVILMKRVARKSLIWLGIWQYLGR